MRFFKKKTSWLGFGLKVAFVLLVLWAAGSAFASRYRIGIDPQQEKCLPGYTVFLLDLRDRAPRRGKIYVFAARGMQPFYANGTRMVKMLAGMPGDIVQIDEQQKITVNGHQVGAGLYLARSLGQPASHFYGKAVLKEGNYWFMGKSFKSFDSRYWGAVKDDQIIGRAYPLF